jgi:uncharacterized membrane protein YgcG
MVVVSYLATNAISSPFAGVVFAHRMLVCVAEFLSRLPLYAMSFVGRLYMYAMPRCVAVVELRAQRHPRASRGSHGRPGWGARGGEAKKPGKKGGGQ